MPPNGQGLPLPDEAELLRAAQAGSSASFGTLAQHYRPMLLRLLCARRLAVHDAEDAVQEALARAYAGLGSYDPARPFGAWLTTIALHVAATHRRGRRVPVVAWSDRADPSPAPAEALSARQEREGLWSLAQSLLPGRQYEALYLRYAGGRSVREVAAALGVSALGARVLLYRARRALLASRRFSRAHGRPEKAEGGQP